MATKSHWVQVKIWSGASGGLSVPASSDPLLCLCVTFSGRLISWLPSLRTRVIAFRAILGDNIPTSRSLT